MNYRAENKGISNVGILPLLEPVPIFHREVAGVRSLREGVYIARNMLNLDFWAINADYAISHKTDKGNSNVVSFAKFYPNPAISVFTIKYELPFARLPLLLQITDAGGKIIEERILINNNDIIEINSENYIRGSYFCSIFEDNKIKQSAKIVIE